MINRWIEKNKKKMKREVRIDENIEKYAKE